MNDIEMCFRILLNAMPRKRAEVDMSKFADVFQKQIKLTTKKGRIAVLQLVNAPKKKNPVPRSVK